MLRRDVDLPYYPRPWALDFHDAPQRWKVLVLHRRAGKTTAVINQLQRDAVDTKDSRFAYIAPTYRMAKRIAWDILKYYARPIPRVDFNESELTVTYPNRAKLTLYGSDNPGSLRGIGLWGAGFDEYGMQAPNIFSEIIRPALSDHNGYAVWFGTPQGKNQFYRLAEQAKEDKTFYYRLLTADDTGLVSQEELADSRKFMTNDEYMQEWYCSWEAAIKGAVYGYELSVARKDKRVTKVPYDRALPVFTVWDLGKGRNMAIGFYQRAYGQVRKIDFWEGSGDDALPDAIKAIRERPYVYGAHFAPHDINVVDLSTGVSRIEFAKKLNLKFKQVPKIPIEEGIHAAKMMWSRLFVDEDRCQTWLDYISQYHYDYDENRSAFKPEPYHDFTSHAADEFRYAAVVEKQMSNDMMEESGHQKSWEENLSFDPYRK